DCANNEVHSIQHQPPNSKYLQVLRWSREAVDSIPAHLHTDSLLLLLFCQAATVTLSLFPYSPRSLPSHLSNLSTTSRVIVLFFELDPNEAIPNQPKSSGSRSVQITVAP